MRKLATRQLWTECLCPPKSYVEILTLKMIALGGWGPLGGAEVVTGSPNERGQCIITEIPQRPLVSHHVRATDREPARNQDAGPRQNPTI